jgi:RNA polymerase sigma factor (sigma-70 family)
VREKTNKRGTEMTIKKEKYKINEDCRNFKTMSGKEQKDFINDVYENVKRYTMSVFMKVGRPVKTTLEQDVFDSIVQDVTFSLIDTLRKDEFDPQKAKFSTVLGTYVKNRVFREKYLESMPKRQGTTVPLEKQNADGTTMDYLPSQDNVEEIVLDNCEAEAKIKLVRNAISRLTPREQVVIEMRMQEKTLEEIGSNINVTRERVRQILLVIFRKLKVYIDIKDLNVS